VGVARLALGFSVAIPVVTAVGFALNFVTRWAPFVTLPLAILLMAWGSRYLEAAKRLAPDLLVPGIGFEQTLSSSGYIRFYSLSAGISFTTARGVIWTAWLFPVGFLVGIVIKGLIVTLFL
jgi:hypothetical protein